MSEQDNIFEPVADVQASKVKAVALYMCSPWRGAPHRSKRLTAIINTATGISVVLAIAGAMLWIRSYSSSDKVARTRIVDADIYSFDRLEAYDISGFLVLSVYHWDTDGPWYRRARKLFAMGFGPTPPNDSAESGVFISWCDTRTMIASLQGLAHGQQRRPRVIESYSYSRGRGPYMVRSGFVLIPMYLILGPFLILPAVRTLNLLRRRIAQAIDTRRRWTGESRL